LEVQWRRAMQRFILNNLEQLDQKETDAWLAGVPPKQKIVGLGSYHLDPATQRAEIAFPVADAWQGKGIGTFLMQMLVRIAKSKNIKGLTA